MTVDLTALSGHAGMSDMLDAYFQALDERKELEAAAGLMPVSRVVECTQRFRTFHPIVRSLHGIVLDDAGTSNHHVALCRTGVKGTVLHLAHDGSSRIVFEDIAGFLSAAIRAMNTDGFVEDEHLDGACILDDQTALRILIDSLRSEAHYEDIVPALVPLLDLDDTDFLSKLVVTSAVYVAEAVCREVVARPAAQLLPVAELGASHAHWMVRNAGALACKRIAALPSV